MTDVTLGGLEGDSDRVVCISLIDSSVSVLTILIYPSQLHAADYYLVNMEHGQLLRRCWSSLQHAEQSPRPTLSPGAC